MYPELLHVIVPYSNPVPWSSRLRLFKEFAAHMIESGVRLHVVECTFGDIPPEIQATKDMDVTHVWATTHIWHKESLINIGIRHLPRDWKYVCWADADIRFRKQGWAAETVKALQHFSIIQPWEACYDLGPNDEHIDLHYSFGCQWIKDPITCYKLGKGYRFAHPGYAWAATRATIEGTGGLMERAILGAGDHHMALGMIGHADQSMPGGIDPMYKRMVMNWQDLAMKHVVQNIGFIPFNIEHAWHGSKHLRKYIDRWTILTRNNFDPDVDVKHNSSGVLDLTGNKPQLKRDAWRYFQERHEDSNFVGGDTKSAKA